MAVETVTRKLTAILYADVAEYSRLTGDDEVGTHKQLSAGLDLISERIEDAGGRVVHYAGDAVLAEFASVVAAVETAVGIQRQLEQDSAEVSTGKRLQFRIGINLGEVIVDRDDIYGDGVNVAARLESLAEPGGICVSQAVVEQVQGKLDLTFEDMGEQEVKNIAKPVRVHRVRLDGTPPNAPKVLHVPDKPSIAVLPFTNMSGDPEQEYLADGLAEDMITALSKISEMFVIARNSTFAYKNKSPDVREVARDLGVANILEGSVRKAGNRVRITAQLVEAATGNHLWAERYDRELADIFDLQDEITEEVVTALQVQLTEGEQVRLRRRQTNDLAGWESYARGLAHFRRFNKQDNARAHELLEKVVQLDPEFAVAWSLLAWAHYADSRTGWTEAPQESFEKAWEFVERSLALDDTQSDAHAVRGALLLQQRRYDDALIAGRKALELGPNVADSYALLAMTLNYVERPDEALGLIERAMRLCPFYPDWYLGIAGVSYRLLGRYDEAIASDKERLERNPDNFFSDFRLAAIYEELGRHDEAREHVAQALKKQPQLTLAQVRISEPYLDEGVLEKYLDLLSDAGLPE